MYRHGLTYSTEYTRGEFQPGRVGLSITLSLLYRDRTDYYSRHFSELVPPIVNRITRTVDSMAADEKLAWTNDSSKGQLYGKHFWDLSATCQLRLNWSTTSAPVSEVHRAQALIDMLLCGTTEQQVRQIRANARKRPKKST